MENTQSVNGFGIRTSVHSVMSVGFGVSRIGPRNGVRSPKFERFALSLHEVLMQYLLPHFRGNLRIIKRAQIRVDVGLINVDEEVVHEVRDGHHDQAPHRIIKRLNLKLRSPVRPDGQHQNDREPARNRLPRKNEFRMRRPQQIHGDQAQRQRAAQQHAKLNPPAAVIVLAVTLRIHNMFKATGYP